MEYGETAGLPRSSHAHTLTAVVVVTLHSKLVDIQLDALQVPPPSVHLAPAETAALMEAPTVTLLSYAAWRR